MPILAISTKDPRMREQDLRLCRQYYGNEKSSFIELDTMGSQTIDINDTRLTVVGAHGSTDREKFGELTPSQLVQKLEEAGLLKKSKVIDLVGCNIGFVGEKESYAHAFSRILFEKKGWRGQVNVLSNSVSEQPVVSLTVTQHEKNRWTLDGVPKGHQADAYFDLVSQIDATYNSKMDSLRKEYKERKANPPAPENKERLRAIQKTFDDLNVEKAQEKERVHQRYQQTLYATTDIRLALDHNKNFQITSELLKEPALTVPRQKSRSLTYNLIADVKDKIHAANQKSSFRIKFFSGRKLARYHAQLACLEAIVTAIQTSTLSRHDVIRSIKEQQALLLNRKEKSSSKMAEELGRAINYMNQDFVAKMVKSTIPLGQGVDTKKICMELGDISPGAVLMQEVKEKAEDTLEKKVDFKTIAHSEEKTKESDLSLHVKPSKSL